MIFENLRAAKNGGDTEARSQMLVASTMAGVAFTNSGVGVVHALAHSVGAKFGTHHGVANCIFLAARNAIQYGCGGGEICEAFQAGRNLDIKQRFGGGIGACQEAIEQLCNDIGLPERLRDAGVPELKSADIEELAFLTGSDPAIMFNPKECSTEDIKGLYERAY